MFPAHIRGDGLTLRALEPADVPAMFAYLQRPAVYEATSSSGWTEASVAEFVRTNREGMADGRWCRYAIIPDGAEAIAGDIGYGAIEHAHRRAEVGYHLSPESWGHGLMTRAVRALNAWAFESGLHRIEATVMEGNVRSERVLARAGFTREATLRDYKLVRGTFRDFSLWAAILTA